MKTKLISTVFFLLIFTSLSARHILGGDFSYQCLGNDMYRIDLTAYRDCGDSGALFDDPAAISIYQGNASPYQLFTVLNVPLSGFEATEAMRDSCSDWVPIDICIEKGFYSVEVELPQSPESYHIIYQRCCRTNTLSNIITPDQTGITVTIEITAFAQQECNTSPVANFTPVMDFCVNEPFEFDLSFTENEGDSLVYELCSPINGGGILGTPENPGDPNACDGVMPVPPCSPPYVPVAFILPMFSQFSPLGSNSNIDLDTETGVLSGTPQITGCFLGGLCVFEYRNGTLISQSQVELTFCVGGPVSTFSLPSLSLDLFPNPATDQIRINLPDSTESYDCTVRNIHGQVVRKYKRISGTYFDLDVTNLSGLYIFEMNSGSLRFIGKTIIL